MEPIQKLTDFTGQSLISFNSPQAMYDYALEHVKKYRSKELESFWTNILKTSTLPITEHAFLREYTWCIYVSGFSAATIAKKINTLLVAHNIEDSAGNYIPITESSIIPPEARHSIYAIFNNKRKANYIQQMRTRILIEGWKILHDTILSKRDPSWLTSLPGIGPALSCHLARNLGNLDVIKPDVHLTRIAKHYNFDNAYDLCKTLSGSDRMGKVDLILWLASVDNGTT